MKIKKLFTVGVCCLALMGCSAHRGDRIVDLEPKLSNFVTNFDKYFLGKNISLFKAAFFGTYEYNGFSRDIHKERRITSYLNPASYSMTGHARFIASVPNIYSCNLDVIVGEGDIVIGLQPPYSESLGRCYVEGCDFANKMMNVFVANYHDGITEDEIARNADVELNKLQKIYNENQERERQQKILAEEKANSPASSEFCKNLSLNREYAGFLILGEPQYKLQLVNKNSVPVNILMVNINRKGWTRPQMDSGTLNFGDKGFITFDEAVEVHVKTNHGICTFTQN